MSARVNAATAITRFGACSRKPSPANCRTASRIGVRLIAISFDSANSESTVPPLHSPDRIFPWIYSYARSRADDSF